MNRKKEIKLKGCIELFVAECELKNLSEKTIQYYSENLGRFIKWLFINKNIATPGVHDFNAEYINQYLTETKGNKKWGNHHAIMTSKERVSSQSVRTYARALRVFGNWLYRERYTNEDILRKVLLPKATEKDKEILTREEIIKIFNTFNKKTKTGLRNYIIFLLDIDAGLRERTFTELKVSDINFEQKTIRVTVKGDRITVLPIGKNAIKALKEYIVKYKIENNSNDYLFESCRGGKLSENAIKQMFRKLKDKSGIARVHCHLGRHTFSTNYIMRGHSSHELMIALTHKTESSAKKYVHLANRIIFAQDGADSYIDNMFESKGAALGNLNNTNRNMKKTA